jgi:hypothetical protein
MNRLVVNGCSYMHSYSAGNGHVELAQQLNIAKADSIAVPGSCNDRILRTTLKDSYETTESTFYVIGLAFLGRSELPINNFDDKFEGKWLSIGNNFNSNFQYQDGWDQRLIDQYIDLKLKYQVYSIDDRLEDLMYRILSTIADLKSRGHQVVLYKQATDVYEKFYNDPRFLPLKKSTSIINGLEWCANDWQYSHGVEWNVYDNKLPLSARHPKIGQFQVLNEFLINYIQDNKLL